MSNRHAQENSSSLIRLLALGTSVNLGGVIVRVAIVFLHSLIAARLFGAIGYGMYTQGIAAVALLSVAAQLGMGRAVTRFVALMRARGESAGVNRVLRLGLVISLPTACIAGLALSLSSEHMAKLFGDPQLVTSFRILGPAVPLLVVTSVLASFTQGFKDMRHKTIAVDIVAPTAELAALLLLALFGVGELGLPLAYTLATACAAMLLVHFVRLDLMRARREAMEQPSQSTQPASSPIIEFGFAVWVGEMLMEFSRRAPVLLLGVLTTSVTVGVFGILQRLVGLAGVFLYSTNLMVGPMVSDLVERRQTRELSRLHTTSARWILGVSLPFFLLVGFYGNAILALFGDSFTGGAQALRFLVASTVVDASTGNSGVILMMSGRPQLNVLNEAVKLFTTVAVGIVLTPKFGLLGAIWAIGIGTVIFSALQVVETWLYLRIQPYSKSTLRILLAGLVMLSLLFVSKTVPDGASTWPRVIVSSGLALMGYVVIMVVWGMNGEDRDILRTARTKLSGLSGLK